MFLSRLSPGVWMGLFFVVFIGKILFLVSGKGVQFFELGGGNDANYYDEMAGRYGEYSVNSWPVFLGILDEFGIYSRVGVSYFLFFLSAVVIPFLLVRVANIGVWPNNRRLWFSVFLVGSYPALFFFSLDIYRDVFMVFVFLLGCFAIKGVAGSSSPVILIFRFGVGLVFAFLLYGLRKYLGVAYAVALFFALICNFRPIKKIQKVRLRYLIFLYIFLLFSGYSFGLFDLLMDYRRGFDVGAGGTTFGLRFDSVALMLPTFVLSFAFQVFGLWLFSGLAIFLFLVESLPFILAFIYILRNKIFLNGFSWSLLVFFVAYNTVWVFGNDNLGTAWRLRVYGYLSILIVFLIVYQEKFKIMRRHV